ncbi:ABC transporter ATP-binding protein [Haloquadratum walsbyi]|uniref:Probable branched-chain amino acid transport ATP-binding protein LivG n=1 Tax=Haloquadratum walsbyi J07HQW2 TaxID=1238425 RepID=U1MX02_9EURY|nr:ABC transporter ATP-binding protein [Haloquadratum walsbyi]ERG94969.1 MAG: ABC-type branched-chain amino acid transport system, ATPase component [Haloquadratum walsbyi J07HQW2]
MSQDKGRTEYKENSNKMTTPDESMLFLKDIVKRFGGLTAVDNVSFTVDPNTITGLIGPNGAGKSTLFNCITGITQPDSGTIQLNNTEIQKESPNQIAQHGLGRTFQTPKIFRGMSVRENLAFAAPEQRGERPVSALVHSQLVKDEEKTIQSQVENTLQFLSLNHLADEYASGLSGGQRKLLELGRVLMLDPDLILLDEPMAGVNPALTDELLDRLHELTDRGRTILLIEHDMDLIMNHCDQVVVLHNGQTLASGPPSVIQDDERVVNAYLEDFDYG